jgi:ribosome-associated toxin RatA of RatAB toxin-antitoxin module
LPAPSEKLFALITDFERYTRFFEGYLNSIKILKKTEVETHTEEVFVFRSLFNHELTQRSIHKIIGDNKVRTEVIFGPFKGSILEVSFEKTPVGTKVTVNADYKVSLKYKIIAPIIKQKYRTIITGLLYKINTMAMES